MTEERQPEIARSARSAQARRDALRSRGGRILQLELEPVELAALSRIREQTGAETDKDAVVNALRAADGVGTVTVAGAAVDLRRLQRAIGEAIAPGRRSR